jgi:Na+-driven multidrug efflux pump
MAMLSGPPRKVILRMSVPTVAAFLVQAVYNVADALFVAHSSEDGTLSLSAMSVATPIEMTVMAMGQMMAGGASVVIARSLGRGDVGSARRAFGTALVGDILLAALLPIALLPYLRSTILPFLGATTATIDQAVDYARVVIFGAMAHFLFLLLNFVLRAQGLVVQSLVTNFSSALLNCLGDYILVIRLGMGPRGAALSTIFTLLGVFVVATALYLRLALSQRQTRTRAKALVLPKLCFKPRLALRIMGLGSSATAVTLTTAATTVAVGSTFRSCISDPATKMAAIASYGGVIARLVTFASMVLNGFASSLQPVVGANHAAHLRERCTAIVALGQRTALCLALFAEMLAITLAFFIGEVFNVNDLTASISRRGTIITFALFVLESAPICFSMAFRALANPSAAFQIVLAKGIVQVSSVLIIPRLCMAVLPDHTLLAKPYVSIWLAFPLATISGCIVARRTVRHKMDSNGLNSSRLLFTQNYKLSRSEVEGFASRMLCIPQSSGATSLAVDSPRSLEEMPTIPSRSALPAGTHPLAYSMGREPSENSVFGEASGANTSRGAFADMSETGSIVGIARSTQAADVDVPSLDEEVSDHIPFPTGLILEDFESSAIGFTPRTDRSFGDHHPIAHTLSPSGLASAISPPVLVEVSEAPTASEASLSD